MRKKDSDYESEEEGKPKIDLDAPRALRQIRKPKTSEFENYELSTIKKRGRKKLTPKKKSWAKKRFSTSDLPKLEPEWDEENGRLNVTIETINPSKYNKKEASPRSSFTSQVSSESKHSVIVLDSNSEDETNDEKTTPKKTLKPARLNLSLPVTSSSNNKSKKRRLSAKLESIEKTIDFVIASSSQGEKRKSLSAASSSKSVYDFESATDDSVPKKMPCLKRNNSKK